MKRDFSRMLDFVEQLRQVDTEGVPPLTSMTGEINQLRPDAVCSELSPEEVFRNAPETDGRFFLVPRVLP